MSDFVKTMIVAMRPLMLLPRKKLRRAAILPHLEKFAEPVMLSISLVGKKLVDVLFAASLLQRRGVYCSTYEDRAYSVVIGPVWVKDRNRLEVTVQVVLPTNDCLNDLRNALADLQNYLSIFANVRKAPFQEVATSEDYKMATLPENLAVLHRLVDGDFSDLHELTPVPLLELAVAANPSLAPVMQRMTFQYRFVSYPSYRADEPEDATFCGNFGPPLVGQRCARLPNQATA